MNIDDTNGDTILAMNRRQLRLHHHRRPSSLLSSLVINRKRKSETNSMECYLLKHESGLINNAERFSQP